MIALRTLLTSLRLTGLTILGIDPGLATVGIGLIERSHASALRLVDFCTIETPKGLPVPVRLQELAADLSTLLEEFRPDLAVVERLYFATNRKTAMDVSAARGVILLTLAGKGIEVLEPTPLQLKCAIAGDGKADKRQMRDMVLRTLHLSKETFAGRSDDVIDALALSLYGAFTWRAEAKVL